MPVLEKTVVCQDGKQTNTQPKTSQCKFGVNQDADIGLDSTKTGKQHPAGAQHIAVNGAATAEEPYIGPL
jgi:hypothetical protein